MSCYIKVRTAGGMIIYGKNQGVQEGKGKRQANNGIYKYNKRPGNGKILNSILSFSLLLLFKESSPEPRGATLLQ